MSGVERIGTRTRPASTDADTTSQALGPWADAPVAAGSLTRGFVRRLLRLRAQPRLARARGARVARGPAGSPPPSPPLRTKWTRRVPHPVRIGHASSPGAGPAETTSPSSGAPRPRVRRAVRARRSRSRSTAGFLTRCGRFTRGTSSRWGRAASGLRPSRPPCTCGTPPGRHVLRRAGGGAPRVDGALHRGRARRPAPARSAPRGSGAEAKHSSRR